MFRGDDESMHLLCTHARNGLMNYSAAAEIHVHPRVRVRKVALALLIHSYHVQRILFFLQQRTLKKWCVPPGANARPQLGTI